MTKQPGRASNVQINRATNGFIVLVDPVAFAETDKRVARTAGELARVILDVFGAVAEAAPGDEQPLEPLYEGGPNLGKPREALRDAVRDIGALKSDRDWAIREIGNLDVDRVERIWPAIEDLRRRVATITGAAEAAPLDTVFAGSMRALRATPADWQPCLYAGGPLSVAGVAGLLELGLVEIEARDTAGRRRLYWRRTADGNRFLAGVDAAFPAPVRSLREAMTYEEPEAAL